MRGGCACGGGRGEAGTQCGKCHTSSTRREAGRGRVGWTGGALGERPGVRREHRAANVAHPARGARRFGVGAVVAVPLTDAGAESQHPRPEPAPLRALAEAGSAAAEREPPASPLVGGDAGDASRARRGFRAAPVPGPVLQSASAPAARKDGWVKAAPQNEQRGEERRRPGELVQPRRVQRAMLRHRQHRLQSPRRGVRGHGERQGESEQGQHGHGRGRGEES